MSVPNVGREFDPVLPPGEAAEYLGFRGKHRTRQLRRLNLERHPLPGTGTVRSRDGHRLSVLNTYLARLNDPKSRQALLREPGPDHAARGDRGRYSARAS